MDDMRHFDRLDQRRRKALAAILDEPSLVAAAKACGFGVATLRRWMKAEAFKRALDEARRVAYGVAVGRLQQGSEGAARALQEVIDDPEASHTVKISAARSILEFAAKSIDVTDLELRIAELEKTAHRVVVRETA